MLSSPRFLLALLVALAFAFWGGRSLRESSEARYGEVAREMIETSDWMAPRLNGRPHLTKPPLAYWFMASGMKLLGVNAWGARLALVPAFLLTVWSLWTIARRMGFSEREAVAACLVQATSAFGFVGSFVLTTDPFLQAFVAAGIASYWVWREEGKAFFLYLFWTLFGLAFLAKGPPAWLHLAPVLVLRARLFRQGQREPRLKAWLGVPLMALIGLSWFLWMIWGDPGLLDYFVRGEVMERVFSAEHGRDNTLLQYPLILAAGIFPYAFVWPEAFRKTRAFFAEGALSSLRASPAWLIFALAWLLVPLAVFCFAKSRMPLYMLPLFPPLSLLLGKSLAPWLERAESLAVPRRRLLAAGAALWAAALVLARATPDSFAPGRVYRDDAAKIAPVLQQVEGDHKLAWLLTRPYHGLGFYLDRVVLDEGLEHAEDLAALPESELAETLFVAKSKRLKRLDELRYHYRVLTDSGDLSLLRLEAPFPPPMKEGGEALFSEEEE